MVEPLRRGGSVNFQLPIGVGHPGWFFFFFLTRIDTCTFDTMGS